MKDKLTPLSQTLRRNMTPEERRLWYCFLKTYPVRFHRQYVIDQYIVDFYCHKAKLSVIRMYPGIFPVYVKQSILL